jgi:hypothetical protein
MKLPFLEQAIVPDAKLVKYLLDPSHPEGRSKAEFFLRLGFTREQPDILRRASLEVAAHTHMQEVIFPYGVKYTGAGLLRTPAGREVLVRTVWALLDRLPPPLLVTAYPAADTEDV